MKERLFHSYQFLLNISVDVVVGAVVMANFFAATVHVHLPWFIDVLLAISVWSIYTLDHLLDAKRLNGHATTLRHSFHHRYFNLLVSTVIFLSSIGLLVAIIYLTLSTWLWGFGAVLIATAHLLLTHFQAKDQLRFVLKEVGVALNYTLGVTVGALSLTEAPFVSFWPYLGALFLCALSNLLMYSLFDFVEDQHNRMASIATILGQRTVKFLLIVIVVLELSCFFYFFLKDYDLLFLGFSASVTFFYVAIGWSKMPWFSKHYKMFADLVFILPILVL